MKPKCFFVLLAASVLSALAENTNRFTIITGATAAGYNIPNTLRLDQLTGQAWVYKFHTNDGFYWEPVQEPNAATLRKFLAWADAHKQGASLTNGAEIITYTSEQIAKRRAEVAAELEGLKK